MGERKFFHHESGAKGSSVECLRHRFNIVSSRSFSFMMHLHLSHMLHAFKIRTEQKSKGNFYRPFWDWTLTAHEMTLSCSPINWSSQNVTNKSYLIRTAHNLKTEQSVSNNLLPVWRRIFNHFLFFLFTVTFRHGFGVFPVMFRRSCSRWSVASSARGHWANESTSHSMMDPP